MCCSWRFTQLIKFLLTQQVSEFRVFLRESGEFLLRWQRSVIYWFLFLTFVVRVVKKPLNFFLITKFTWSCRWFWFYWSLFTEFEKFLSHASTLTFTLYIFTLRLLELWLVETENGAFTNVCCSDSLRSDGGIRPRGGNPSLHCFHSPLVMFVFCYDIIEHNASDLWEKKINKMFSVT